MGEVRLVGASTPVLKRLCELSGERVRIPLHELMDHLIGLGVRVTGLRLRGSLGGRAISVFLSLYGGRANLVSPGQYDHPKTGGKYTVMEPGPLGAAIDCTNGSSEGRRMVVYRRESDNQLFVREELEFAEQERFQQRE